MYFLSILVYKANAFSSLTKHLAHTVAITFAVWGERAKLAWGFFSHNFSDGRFTLTTDFSNQQMIFRLSLISWELSAFHRKEASYGFFLA